LNSEAIVKGSGRHYRLAVPYANGCVETNVVIKAVALIHHFLSTVRVNHFAHFATAAVVKSKG
jgi:hypothetical protein